VEDDAAVRELAATILAEHGYQVLSASSGPSALQTRKNCETRIDLLLTDVVMPHMNGRQLAKRLQSRWDNLRVLYMSGYSSDVIAYHGVLDEGIAILQKPFTLDSLTREVRAALDR
jgi:two-component system cell cycle sensor histidine kinase/response regulator CckA